MYVKLLGEKLSRSCAKGGVGSSFSRGNGYVRRLGLHYISRSGLSSSGILGFKAARILACYGVRRATRRTASFLPSVLSRKMSPIWISPNWRR
jgi:hypothetical protein